MVTELPQLLALAMAFFVIAIVFYYQARTFPVSITGMREWGVGFAVLGLSVLVSALNHEVQSVALGLADSVLVLLGLAAFYAGLCVFQGESPHYPWVIGTVGLSAVVLALLITVEPLVWASVGVNSLLIGLLLLPSFYRLLQRRNDEPFVRFSRIFTLGFTGLILLGVLARGAYALSLLGANSSFDGQALLGVSDRMLGAFFPVVLLACAMGLALMAFDRLQDELEFLVTRDALTGVYSRRGFMSLAEGELGRADRQKTPVALLMIDLDHFKQINDLYGHAAGDRVLAAFARIAQSCLRREDLLGRYGGEEFLILLPGAAPYASLIVAERIRTAVNASLVPVGKHNIRFTVSVGVANSALGLGEKELLTDRVKRADDAMYKAKGFGRNRVEVST